MVPRFDKFFYPVLKFLEDQEIHNMKEAISFITDYFTFSEEDLQEKVKSGRCSKVYDRVLWTMTYLRESKLLVSPSRGQYQITAKGLEVLNSGISDFDAAYLCSISPEFQEFAKGKKSKTNSKNNPSNVETEDADSSSLSPSESIAQLINQINCSLATELLEHIKNQTPAFFEQLVIDLLVKMGYGGNREDAATVTSLSHDGGIDGIIKEDRLGLDMIYIQAKRWDNTVQKPEIQKFRGALSERGANKGIFITTSDFSSGAKESARNAKIVLIDGSELCRLMIEFGVGVSTKTIYEIKRVDTDYFNPEV